MLCLMRQVDGQHGAASSSAWKRKVLEGTVAPCEEGSLPGPAPSSFPHPCLAWPAGSPAPRPLRGPRGTLQAEEPEHPSLPRAAGCWGLSQAWPQTPRPIIPSPHFAHLLLSKSSRAAVSPAQPHPADFSDPLFTQAWVLPPAPNLRTYRWPHQQPCLAAPLESSSVGWGRGMLSLLDPHVELTCSQR